MLNLNKSDRSNTFCKFLKFSLGKRDFCGLKLCVWSWVLPSNPTNEMNATRDLDRDGLVVFIITYSSILGINLCLIFLAKGIIGFGLMKGTEGGEGLEFTPSMMA